ncbi:MAG: LysM peptidoglycan-binding domain-containing protein [Anaerolineae bacterium]|nr:LysM peptidoglycan-binding domain-containing protein [Thermoflexales bacterium]MDW8408018.1 LysM peptidoglycan-binding domain-containing protein [Anaerolineae bacterium]
MRQQFFRPFRAAVWALAGSIIVTGCAQPASVGIPTPNADLIAARQTTVAQSLAEAAAAQTAAAPTPTFQPEPPTPTPIVVEIPIDTPAPLPALPTETPLPPDARSPASPSVSCGQQIIHVVQPGQNLFRIALRYHTTINAIARLNGITNTRLVRVGQRLRIITCARGNSKTPSSGGHYVVRPGDTLYRIAVRYGVSVRRLMAANGLRSTLIVPGQNLVIP